MKATLRAVLLQCLSPLSLMLYVFELMGKFWPWWPDQNRPWDLKLSLKTLLERQFSKYRPSTCEGLFVQTSIFLTSMPHEHASKYCMYRALIARTNIRLVLISWVTDLKNQIELESSTLNNAQIYTDKSDIFNKHLTYKIP